MNTTSPVLTLSEAPHDLGNQRGEPVSHIRAELRRITTARRHGAKRTARVHLDRLIDYVWFSDPDGAA